jgi:antitoxin YefM
MQAISYTQANKSLKTLINQVITDHAPVLIRRRGGGNVVLISEQDFNSMQETLYLLSTSANAKKLFKSVDQLTASKSKIA